jgi:hypothetical protein
MKSLSLLALSVAIGQVTAAPNPLPASVKSILRRQNALSNGMNMIINRKFTES